MPENAVLPNALDETAARCLTMDAPLAIRLDTYANEVRKHNPDFAEIVDRLVARLSSSGAGDLTPALGEPMPPFLLPDQNGKLVALGALLAEGPVVVAFLRGNWCPYCRINADALARVQSQVRAAGGQIVAITPNLGAFNKALQNATGAAFPILTDLDNGYALQLDLAFRIPDEKRAAMSVGGWDLSPYQGNDAWILPIPATFVVGRDGRVRARFVDPDYRKRMAVEDILSALRSG
jgi:peroxiredoxin